MAAPLGPSADTHRPGPATGGDAARQIAELTAELQEREQLIEALTERLEEAAEQLDRIHRSGGNRATAAPSLPGIAPELMERHLMTAEKLDLFLTDWEEKQGLHLIEHMDRRIDKLVDLLRGGVFGGADDDAAQPEAVEPQPEQPKGESRLRSISAEAADYSPGEPTWSAAPQPEIPLADPPEPVADDEQDPVALMTAVRAREDYISYLISELRHHQPQVAIDWNALKEAPEELRVSLETLEKRLRKELQREELDLSLERARVARESSHLEQVRTRLEKEIKRMGIGQESESPKGNPAVEDSSAWRRLFGKK